MFPKKTMVAMLAATLSFSPLIGMNAYAEQVNSSLKSNGSFQFMDANISDIQKALAEGKITSQELVMKYLQRINQYNQQGPKVNSIISLNPNALQEAAALDKERKDKGPRGPLHGIPIVLKDNYDTYDLPTTGGNLALKDVTPPTDAFLTKKLRDAGAIILAKTNLHEFARSGTTVSSLGGQTLNPYDLTRTPGGSSGGTGVAVTSNFATAGMGTDTVNSVRSPSSANNLVGLRPTKGLLSRAGIIPVSTTQDMAGPITRSVEDAAVMLDALVGYDKDDPSTAWGIGHSPKTYTDYLKKDGLKGKRLGVLRTLFGKKDINAPVNQVIEKDIQELKALGAEIVDIDVPDLDTGKVSKECDVQVYESKPLLDQYFASLGDHTPVHSLKDLLDTHTVDPTIEKGLEDTEALDNALDSPDYKDHLVKIQNVRDVIMQTMAEHNLDAIVYPHQKRLVVPIGEDQVERNGILAGVTGFPALTVQGGFSQPTATAPIGVPVGIEFLGRPWDEPKLIEMGYSYEQGTHHRKLPVSTP